ncbi:MAG: hypothetical protein JWN32_1942 [Solirubrobacterales bacterium]|nr:hypothetical protein [Solirubrobacterales bacterium]
MPEPNHPPTARQQRYLRQLASQRGQTFSPPKTRAEASQEIERLLAEAPSSRSDRLADLRSVRAGLRDGPADAVRVRPDELTGHGSTAAWNGEDR